MKPLLQLNLQDDREKPESANPKPESAEPVPPVVDKRLNRLARKAAHKAAMQYGRSGSGIFSK